MRLVDAEGQDIPLIALNLAVGRVLVVMPPNDDSFMSQVAMDRIAGLFNGAGITVIVLPHRVTFAAIDL